MFKVAAVVWLMLGTVLAGVAMVVIVSVPSLYDQGFKYIPYLCGGGFAVAIPLSLLVAWLMTRPAEVKHLDSV
ncbi:MAG: hypothetical protein F9K29_07165 [Hyphomicrobiaceae bacterium]|nr:MAG: hypothetical protein F9K29_07165 [Hyphomicrobiaceae bacterium]